jgi:hypothetical protein
MEPGGKGSFQAVKLQRPARTTVCSHSIRDMAAICSIEYKQDHNGAQHECLSGCVQFSGIRQTLPVHLTVNCRSPKLVKKIRKCLDVYRHRPSPFLPLLPGGMRRLFSGRVHQLPPTREASGGNSIDHSSRSLLAWRWWLGVFPLAQELALLDASWGETIDA